MCVLCRTANATLLFASDLSDHVESKSCCQSEHRVRIPVSNLLAISLDSTSYRSCRLHALPRTVYGSGIIWHCVHM